MADIAAKLILTNKLQFEEGEIKLFGTDICLIPPEVYLFLYKELEKLGKEKIFYETSKESAYIWFSNLSKGLEKKEVEDLFENIPKILNLLGYGKLSINKKDFAKRLFEFSLETPLFPELYGNSKKAIDVAFAGLLVGAVSAILKKSMTCSEIQCVSQGNKYCKFAVTAGANNV